MKIPYPKVFHTSSLAVFDYSANLQNGFLSFSLK